MSFTLAAMIRSCRRTACQRPAAASLSYCYASAQVWLEDVHREPEPQRWDICREHAELLTIPLRWELMDVRSSTVPTGDAAASPSGPSCPPRPNRYSDLEPGLPELAASRLPAADGDR